MNKQPTTAQRKFGVQLFALFTCLILSATSVLAKEAVTLKGFVFVHDDTVSDIQINIIGNDKNASVQLLPGGKFKVKVAPNSKVVIQFEKEGYLSKEIAVNTENVYASKRAQKENRVLRFDVELLPENHGKQLQFEEPVGRINFLNGSGLMQINYLYQLKEVAVRIHDGKETTP